MLKKNHKYSVPNHLSFNLIKNLFARELGTITAQSFIGNSNTRRLDDIRLSKYRSIPSLNRSVCVKPLKASD
jgi:hypothetical protein